MTIRNIFTDGGNEDLDFTKVLGAAGFVVFLLLSTFVYGWQHKDWDPMTWSGAVAVLLGAVGGVSKIRDYSVPADKETK